MFARVKKWLTKEGMYGHEIRGTTMRTRFKLELLAEQGKQKVFQDLLSPQYNARVQTAVEHRLMRMSEVGFARSKRFKEFERRTFFPAVGALARKPEKQSHLDEKLEEPLAQLTWRGMDRAIWMIQNASYEDLGKFVDNPETFQDNAKTMPIIAFDQTPLWLKLRGEEKILITRDELDQRVKRRRLSNLLKKPDISIQDKAKFSQELQTIIDENPDFKSESHTKVSQGGDKHRLTLTTFQVVRGWFDPDSTPAGEIPVNILIVPSAKHCRLEDISPEGLWERDVQYQIDDELIQYKQGEKVNRY